MRHEIFFGEGCEGDCGRVRSACEATLSGGRTMVKPVHVNCSYFLVVEISNEPLQPLKFGYV